jgi:hypothetical protein
MVNGQISLNGIVTIDRSQFTKAEHFASPVQAVRRNSRSVEVLKLAFT